MTNLKTLRAEAKSAKIKGAWAMNTSQLIAALARVPAAPLNDYRIEAEERIANAVLLEQQRGIKTSKNNDLYLPQARRVAYRVLRKEIATDKLSRQHKVILAACKDAHWRSCDEIATAALDLGLVTRQKPAYIAATALSKFNKLGLIEKKVLPRGA